MCDECIRGFGVDTQAAIIPDTQAQYRQLGQGVGTAPTASLGVRLAGLPRTFPLRRRRFSRRRFSRRALRRRFRRRAMMVGGSVYGEGRER